MCGAPAANPVMGWRLFLSRLPCMRRLRMDDIHPVMETKMISVDVYIHIYRPLQQVFTFVATPENDFQWQYETLASTQVSKGEIGVGTLFHTVGHFMGRRIETVYEVTDFDPHKRYGFKSHSGPVDSHTLYTFEITNGGTKISLSTKTTPRDLFTMNPSMVEKKSKKQHKENLAILKNILEAHRIVSP